ncbi:MAG: cupin domain-containing protein [Neptuniibacter sp.]
MKLNENFQKNVTLHSNSLEWISSPMRGVERKMLERIGDEVVDRATSIVRYAAGSRFSSHAHDGGEEFIVLEGVFQDEHGDYPAGSYLRNPPTSQHTPRSENGCIIFVKLAQFDPKDRTSVKLDTNKMMPVHDKTREGVSVIPLFQDDRENVRIEIWEAGREVQIDATNGAEILLLDGQFQAVDEIFEKQSWMRLAPDQKISAVASSTGAKVWVKSGHLRNELSQS